VAGFSDDVLRESLLQKKNKMIRKMNKPKGLDLAIKDFQAK